MRVNHPEGTRGEEKTVGEGKEGYIQDDVKGGSGCWCYVSE